MSGQKSIPITAEVQEAEAHQRKLPRWSKTSAVYHCLYFYRKSTGTVRTDRIARGMPQQGCQNERAVQVQRQQNFRSEFPEESYRSRNIRAERLPDALPGKYYAARTGKGTATSNRHLRSGWQRRNGYGSWVMPLPGCRQGENILFPRSGWPEAAARWHRTGPHSQRVLHAVAGAYLR